MRRRIPILTLTALLLCLLSACAPSGSSAVQTPEPVSSMELDYATQFTVDKYQDGSALVTIAGQDRYLIVPEGAEPNETLSRGAAVIAAPVENLYLAASSAMDLFRALDELDRVTMTSTTAENWSIPEIRDRIDFGSSD